MLSYIIFKCVWWKTWNLLLTDVLCKSAFRLGKPRKNKVEELKNKLTAPIILFVFVTKVFIFFFFFDKIFFLNTVFPHIVAAATILFWIHLVRKLFKFSFPLCNENLNSFLTRWGNYSRRGNYSREETIWGNTVYSS